VKVLLSWLGKDELRRSGGDTNAAAPLADALAERGETFDEIVLLNNQLEEAAQQYAVYVGAGSTLSLSLFDAPLKSPVDYGEIHRRAVEAVESVRKRYGAGVQLAFFLNSGTAPMGSVWLLLGKSRYPAELLAWSNFHKCSEIVDVPFEISAEFIPALLQRTDAVLRESNLERAPPDAAFSSIIHQCGGMRDLLERAKRVSIHNVPVLLEGESGTGKEILARAIHNASPRRNRPFLAVNCGAIPEHLAESEFFGHVKGAFTGSTESRSGHFREAQGGTLFLDEIGELPLPMQVKLLRPLQEGQMVPVGASKTIDVDVRIIAATHRSLVDDVAAGRFREDLFYRLAVAVLKVPALREREGDLTPLAEHLLKAINDGNARVELSPRSLSPGAMNALLGHNWPGNVRELANTLRRAIVWSTSSALEAEDIEGALLPSRGTGTSRLDEVLDRPLGAGFRLDDVLEEVQQVYVKKALEVTKGKKREAARLLGLKSHQVLTNRMKRAGKRDGA